MNEKINNILISVVFLLIGILAGWFIWGKSSGYDMVATDHLEGDMTSMMGDMNAALYGKSGDNFDMTFLGEMIVHHQGAVDMANLALQNAKHDEIKNLANGIIKTQTEEIANMKSWQNSWYNN